MDARWNVTQGLGEMPAQKHRPFFQPLGWAVLDTPGPPPRMACCSVFQDKQQSGFPGRAKRAWMATPNGLSSGVCFPGGVEGVGEGARGAFSR